MPCDGVTVRDFVVANAEKRGLLSGEVVATVLANYLPVQYPALNVSIPAPRGDYLSFAFGSHQVSINAGRITVSADRYNSRSIAEADAIGQDLQELLDITAGQLLQARLYQQVKQSYAVVDEGPGQRPGTIRLTVSI